MPGLLKRPSLDRLNSLLSRQSGTMNGQPSPSKMMETTTRDRRTRYVPPQMDPLSTTSTRKLQHNPLMLMILDLQTLARAIPYAPWMLYPTKSSFDKDELRWSLSMMKVSMLQTTLLGCEMLMLMALVPAMLALPGVFFMTCVAGAMLLVQMLAWPLNGSRLVFSRMDKMTKAIAEHHRDERWVFVNGFATSCDGIQDDVDRISRIFGRAVMGIHNRTYGMVADVAQCLVQRVLGYNGACVRATHDQIKAMLCDPTVTKVCLMGHGSGAMVISMVLDHLYDELPSADMSKLEIYTFGSAASCFLSPRHTRGAGAPAGGDRAQMQRDCPYIEHYANENDMVSRWGVLHGSREVPSNRYGGAVFLRNNTGGHLFNQHYLNPMFGQLTQPPMMAPESPQQQTEPAWMSDPFLDMVVIVDEETVARREGAALEKVGIMRRESGMEFGSVHRMTDGSLNMRNGMLSKPGDLMMAFERTPAGRLVTDDARGKTVRELSRLWRYQGGKNPDGPSVNGYHYHDETPPK